MKLTLAMILCVLLMSCATQPKPAPIEVTIEPPIPPVSPPRRPLKRKLSPLEKKAFDYVLSPDATPEGIEVMREILRNHQR